MVLVTAFAIFLSGTMQISTPGVTTVHARTIQKSSCFLLKLGQTVKGVVSGTHPCCFLIAVPSGEAVQLTITQPEDEDLEIHVRGKVLERLVDGFDMGNETVTLQTAGSYRVEVGEVKTAHGVLTISASLQSLPLAQAPAWAEAERWATMSKRSRTLDQINQSLTLWRQLSDTSSIARTYLKLESFLRQHDALAAARANAELALELCRSISDLRCAAEAANNSAVASRQLGDIDRAKERLDEAAQDWGKLHDLLNQAKTRSNLGALLWQSGDFEDAIISLDLARHGLRGRNPPGYARVLNVLGLYDQSLAEYEKAQGYFEGAIAGLAQGSPGELLLARLNLGRTYMLEGHLKCAQFLLEQVLGKARRLSDRRAIRDSLRNLGQTLWKQGDTEHARARFEEALELDRSDGDKRGESSALHYLGLVAQRSGDLSSARTYLTHALEIRRESGLRDDAAESLSVLADLEYGDGKLDAARDYAEQALKILESVRSQVPSPALRASFYSRKRQFFDLLVEMAMAPDTPQANIEGLLAVERGRARALMDLLAGGSLLQQVPKDMAEQRASIQRSLDYLATRLSSVPPEQQDELRRKIQRLVAENEVVEAQIRQAVAGEKLGQPLTSMQEIQHDALPANSALLEFHLGIRKSYLWLVDAQQVRAYSLPPAALIESVAAPIVKGFGQILERRSSPAKQAEFERALKRLSTTLLGELSSVQLPQLLILVPDGVLHRLPFAALQLPGDSSSLGLVHDLIQAPSATYLTFGRQPRQITQFPQTILAMVDPVFSSGDPRVPPGHAKIAAPEPDIPLARLPFTFETKTIESLVPAERRKILRGFDASLATLSGTNLADFAVLHFSTHALIDDGIPELSHLALSRVDSAGRPVEGSLRPYQLAQFHLNGSIVVLSACDTALGKQVSGEGLMGLTSSLFYAGGSQLVLTLTEIDAEGSSHFLSEAYRRFLPGANSMEHSITLARRALVRDPQFSDPYYWASFIVVGRPAGSPERAKANLNPAYNTE